MKADRNGQAVNWCEYIPDKRNLRRVQKDRLISFAGSQHSVPPEYAGRDVAVVALDCIFKSTLALIFRVMLSFERHP